MIMLFTIIVFVFVPLLVNTNGWNRSTSIQHGNFAVNIIVVGVVNLRSSQRRMISISIGMLADAL